MRKLQDELNKKKERAPLVHLEGKGTFDNLSFSLNNNNKKTFEDNFENSFAL
jgi:hypothetical protein